MEERSVNFHEIEKDLEEGYNGSPVVKFHGIVQKIVDGIGPEVEKVEIVILGADDLYKEIRIPNVLRNAAGEKVQLQTGTDVAVIIVARVPRVHSIGTPIDEAVERSA